MPAKVVQVGMGGHLDNGEGILHGCRIWLSKVYYKNVYVTPGFSIR